MREMYINMSPARYGVTETRHHEINSMRDRPGQGDTCIRSITFRY